MLKRKVFLLGVAYPKSDWEVILLHIPVGLAAPFIIGAGYVVGFLWLSIALATIFASGFFLYEIVELIKLNLAKGWDKAKDSGYPELAGFCWGVVLGFVALLLLKITGVI